MAAQRHAPWHSAASSSARQSSGHSSGGGAEAAPPGVLHSWPQSRKRYADSVTMNAWRQQWNGQPL
jgi:hypothetical protein